MCGGTPSPTRNRESGSGLSPRVRGNHYDAAHPPPEGGSIPACAGEPIPQRQIGRGGGVYPRVCGGTPCFPSFSRRFAGLSPRVRGNPEFSSVQRWGAGSIPACAGEPGGGRCGGAAAGVYPRVCGGTEPPPRANWAARGLSPRVRGNRVLLASYDPILRSIPACAGEPDALPAAMMMPTVYPRVCGGTTSG